MECPYCTTSLPEDDLFCEVCGKPLNNAVQTAQATGCACGAPADEIDEDGYCGRCGHLARRPASDHIEMILSPDFAGVSDRGMKHQRNEDRFAIRAAGLGYVLVVCDGVSSSTLSEQASTAVAESVAASLERSLVRHSASSPERTVRMALQEAQSKLAETKAEPDGSGASDSPSTTVIAALVNGLDAIIGWAGDSRAYWISTDGDAQQLTADHSWMNDVVSSGEMTLDEAAKAPQAHGITRWLGADADESAIPDVIRFRIPGAGQLLLCTDGLWNYAQEPRDIARLIHAADSSGETDAIASVRRMIEFANVQGGHDNITAVLLRFREENHDIEQVVQ